MTDWTPETNRLTFGLLTEDEKAALQACEHGWEVYFSGKWETCATPAWWNPSTDRAKPAPRRIVSWHNVYAGRLGGWFNSREEADDQQLKDRLCVYRIEELEAKLAKAVTLAEKSMKWLRLYGADVHREASTLAELKGESHE